jgi:tRNA(Ile2) C34 agmatinyltransferase TiaS
MNEHEMHEHETFFCPVCDGPGMFLGSLGNRDHFRCRDCGMGFSHENEGASDVGQTPNS